MFYDDQCLELSLRTLARAYAVPVPIDNNNRTVAAASILLLLLLLLRCTERSACVSNTNNITIFVVGVQEFQH